MGFCSKVHPLAGVKGPAPTTFRDGPRRRMFCYTDSLRRSRYHFGITTRMTRRRNLYSEGLSKRLSASTWDRRRGRSSIVTTTSEGLSMRLKSEENLSLSYNFSDLLTDVRKGKIESSCLATAPMGSLTHGM